LYFVQIQNLGVYGYIATVTKVVSVFVRFSCAALQQASAHPYTAEILLAFQSAHRVTLGQSKGYFICTDLTTTDELACGGRKPLPAIVGSFCVRIKLAIKGAAGQQTDEGAVLIVRL
jgi:hypothetical protein